MAQLQGAALLAQEESETAFVQGQQGVDKAAMAFQEQLRKEAETRPQRILVVEDDTTINDIITLLLGSEGYGVTSVFSAQEAMEALRKARFDLVTLDLALGDRDGRELMRQMKADSKLHDIPVLIVSAYTGWLTSEERRMAAGILEKPFDVEDLVQRVRALIGAPSPGDRS